MVAACLAVMAALAGGCGSSDSSSSSADTTDATAGEATGSSSASADPLTKKEFIKQANQICQTGLRKKDTALTAALNELPPPSSGESRRVAGKIVILAILHVYGEIIEQLDELSPPKKEEAEVNLIVQKYEAAMQGAEKDPASASNKNPFQVGDRAAEAYGITSCIL